MAFRERVKRALHRSRSTPKPNCTSNGIKIEYYRRHEVPPSKFRGPFDPDHQKMLAAYNLQTAQEDRPRSPDLSLSPCATLPPEYRPQPLDSTSPEGNAPSDLFNNSPTVSHDEYAQDRQGNESQSSTAVDSDSFNASMMTLPMASYRNDSIAKIKESVRYTSPVRAISTHAMPPMTKQMPFSPEDLSRALNSVQICT
ncbi:hypothetical protein PHISCL_00681 [Aspergillus sclerotialis]|uniref:Uncharacterized protein n=1 Tax=Aspergillus sclerotialis TaxID=2070753 RepID=A0A3A2ZW95_9EURO|nr:hypothetical protein PHISCL_00681 [Aspergillus sclerotialis]